MSSAEDKIKGNTNEAVGKIKQGVGEATGNGSMKREGQRQEVKGDAQQLKGDVKDTVKDRVDRA
ncbi:CsbD family protein [Stutzerimonas nosocomialis]|uniref:CsbD family protein n=1 Tax=Stutzerimonas nosocomialis TaxID=1056496 RepID=A0A5R9QF40_9GAMM|nr:CsbD family protein [Stutzerimonas nosocomialis]TLX53644.1 CsbD family protein [Stutzerimonas nosocomialis]TLX55007.1 CsbD family protein [Stutzerimonas nosocomialis]TLX63528.1 CsbD family protein [Stutzerimonas nosocomialis]